VEYRTLRKSPWTIMERRGEEEKDQDLDEDHEED
jgi:hypothetical protein